jgi:hypothetical protein
MTNESDLPDSADLAAARRMIDELKLTVESQNATLEDSSATLASITKERDALKMDNARLREALMRCKYNALTCKSAQTALHHIIRVAIDAGIRENADCIEAALNARATKGTPR